MKRTLFSITLGLALVMAVLLWLPSGVHEGSAASNTIFVNQNVASGPHDGESWETAYPSLQDALSDAEYGDEIWVAAGVYTPGGALPSATFRLKSGVEIYGGFAATETQQTQRDWTRNLTILSGDLAGDDANEGGVITTTSAITNTNAYHVVSSVNITTAARLDGFIVTGGSATNTDEDARGGGMTSNASSPIIANITFIGNRAAREGGGMYNNASNPTLANVTFKNNVAGEGGGMYNNVSNPTLANAVFSGNRAEDKSGGTYQSGNGGGMYNLESSPTLANVAFNNNTADGSYGGGGMCSDQNSNPNLAQVSFERNEATLYDGGGMAIYDFSNATLTDVTFSNNTAGNSGGGVFNEQSKPSLTNVTFSNNQAQNSGGGMVNMTNGNARLTNVIFRGNQAREGGGMYNTSEPTLVNIIFSGNYAEEWGGAILNWFGNPVIIHATFSGNFAEGIGGAIYNYHSHSTLVNCIVWGNQDSTGPSQIYDGNNGTTTITYSDISDSTYTGEGNIYTVPSFVAPISAENAPSTDGNYHLDAASSAIDAGSNLSVTVPTDLDGNLRIVDGNQDNEVRVDMGAYEFQAYRLDVILAGSGTGSVSSSPAGIACPGDCTQEYPSVTAITLTATSSITSTFAGWNGACNNAEPICLMTLNNYQSITATFTLLPASENPIYLPLLVR